jgi:colanic acid biosynthesis glycosyl transferase WcaI
MKQSGIAIITSNYWPEKTGIGQVTTEFAEFLQLNGIPVSVATAFPYYPEWRISEEYRGSAWRTEERHGVVIHRAAHYAAPNPSTWSRLLHEFTLCALSLPNMVRVAIKSREVFIISPDLSHAFVGSVVAGMFGVPVTVIIQDIMPDAAVEMGMLSNRYAILLSRWLARRLYSSANRIFTLSEGMKRRIGGSKGVQDKISIVPNTVDETEFGSTAELGSAFRKKFVPEGTFSVLHTGNMGEKQDLPLLLRAARRLRENSRIHFYVFGDGAVKKTFLRQRDSWQLRNLSHFPLQERSLLPHMLHGADVCIVSQTAQVVDIVVPSKLITSMAAGAMIVAACPADSETAKVLAASGGGLIVPSGDDEALVAAIGDIVTGQVNVREHRRRVRDYALKHFSREEVYRPIVQRLKDSAKCTAD